jgi:hypothetical protein
MNRKTILLVCLLGLSTIIFAQDNDKSKFGYGMSLGFGNSTLENNQLGVLNGSLVSMRFNIDYSFTEKNNTKLTTGIEIIEFNSNFFNGLTQNKLKNEYLQIPLRLTHRIHIDKEEKLNLVTGIGTYANFLMRSNINSLSDKFNTKSGGVNFGYNITLGMEYNISQNTTFLIHSNIMNELNAIKKNGYEQKQTEIVLFNIGFSTKF